jgi:hypothetical protein
MKREEGKRECVVDVFMQMKNLMRNYDILFLMGKEEGKEAGNKNLVNEGEEEGK